MHLEDRYLHDRDGIDVLLTTLDAERYLDDSLLSLYSEVPVARLLVCDAGSKDKTLEILKNYPRVEVFQPGFRTHGKEVEFLLSKARTEWIMWHESDHTYSEGWYDEMCKYRDKFDAFDSKRIHAFEFFREDRVFRGLSPQIGKLATLKQFKADDDCLTRIVDIALRQSIVKAGYRYGRAPTATHYHHTVEETRYATHPTKRATTIVFAEPKEVIIDKENWRRRLVEVAKGYIKYIDPDYPEAKNDLAIDMVLLPLLDRGWVVENGSAAWVARYDRAMRPTQRVRRFFWKLHVFLVRIRAGVHYAFLGVQFD
jgi:glycosyltransferase involved in cell wall biosynthesis